MNGDFSKAVRLAGALALGVTMLLPGAIVSPAVADDAGTSTGVQHYLDCFGELLNPNHAQDCGSNPGNQGDPMGLSHTSSGPNNGCTPVTTSFRSPLLPMDKPLAAALDDGVLLLALTPCVVPCSGPIDYRGPSIVDAPTMASRTEDDAGPMLVRPGSLVACD